MDVLCVGHAAWDISVFVDGYPAENSKSEIRTMIECGGGPAANAAYLLAHWGVSCGIAATIGADRYGDRIREEFLGVGADVTALRQAPDYPTPLSIILVNERNASRTIVNRKADAVGGDSCRQFCGETAAIRRRESPPTASVRQLGLPSINSRPRVLLFDGHELDASRQAMALFPEARTVLDAGSMREGTAELARHVDYLVSSERFARQFAGLADLDSPENQARAIAALCRLNGRPVVITRGEREILYGTGERIERLPVFAATAVDTTAAGDVFHGAFVYGVLTGLDDRENVRLAAAAAALSVAVRGGRTSIPRLSEVRALLASVPALSPTRESLGR